MAAAGARNVSGYQTAKAEASEEEGKRKNSLLPLILYN